MKYITLIAIILMVTAGNITYSQPSATVQFIGGYSVPLGDYTGTFGDTRDKFTGNGNPDSNTYFMKPGVNYGIFLKFPVKRESPFSIKGGIAFNAFGQSKVYEEGTGSVSVDLSQSILGITMGAEYDPVHWKSKIRPFFGAELSLNFISGKYTEDYIDSTETFDMKGATRVGVNLSAGVDFILHNNIGVLVGAKYVFANLIGKSYMEDTRKTYGLNDDAYTSGNISYPSRNITFLQLYGGMSFYFGR
jgi:hypothetical protein